MNQKPLLPSKILQFKARFIHSDNTTITIGEGKTESVLQSLTHIQKKRGGDGKRIVYAHQRNAFRYTFQNRALGCSHYQL
jgi:hypothetical protein